MTKWIETTGRSEEDAIAAALFQLGLDRDDVSVEVIERAKSGFLGFGGNPAKVRVSYEVPGEEEEVPAPKQQEAPAAPIPPKKPVVEEKKPEPDPQAEKAAPKREDKNQLQPGDEILIGNEESSAPKGMDGQPPEPAAPEDQKAARIREFLGGLMEHLHVEATPDIYVSETGYKVILQGRGLGAIIGRRGETLDAIQQLTSYAVNRTGGRVRVQLDAEGYRNKREQSLQHLARKVASKVTRYHRSVTLEPMNAYERHVIHVALQDVPGVTTHSTGVDPNRRVVVTYDRDKK